MNQFNGIIKAEEETLNFSFSRVYTTEGEKFFVTATTNKGYYNFDMKKDSKGKWRISDIAPQSLKEFEERLSNIIEQNIYLP